MKLLYITNVPVPYRVDFFNELGKFCQLTVLFEKESSTERNELWKKYDFINFTGIVLKGISINTDSAICPSIIRYLKKLDYEYLIIDNLSSPTGMMAMQYAQKHKIPYGFEIDGGFAKSGKGIKEKIKKHFVSGAQYYFSPAAEGNRYLIQYGAIVERIYRYPFTSIKNKDVLINVPSYDEKMELRRKLGIKEEKMILSVGRYIHLKGYDWLMKAATELDSSIGIYIIGGKPTEEYLSYRDKMKLTQVHFIDFMTKTELKEWYMSADVFVLPTRSDVWGLVINEAMSCGLPIITTKQCVAGLELVREGENGYLVEVEDVENLRKKINMTLQSESDRRKMGTISLKIIRNYTIEKMAERHIEVLSKGKPIK